MVRVFYRHHTNATGLLPAGSVGAEARCENFPMTAVPENFVAGLEGVVAFTTEIAEPDKDGGALRYRGVDIEDLVRQRVMKRAVTVVHSSMIRCGTAG